MITGSLQIKKNMYYAVLNITDKDGVRKQKWIPTKLSVDGHNKRAAKKFLDDTITEYQDKSFEVATVKKEPLAEYAEKWIIYAERVYDPITFQGYKIGVESHIVPYFKRRKVAIQDLTPEIVEDFSAHMSECGNVKTGGGLSNKSVRNYLTVLSVICDDAVNKKKISENPVSKIKRPKKQKFKPSFYASSQMRNLFQLIQGEKLAPLITVTALYGLRRSELLGLKWDSIDFNNKQVVIKHVVCRCSSIVEKDDTKTDDSYRVYPMTPEIEKIFTDAKAMEELKEKLLGDKYIKNDYVFKWDSSKPYSPDYITKTFHKILERHGMPDIRLHDLRHSCASILLESGHNLKDVQQWLGHSDIQTTGNVYGHLTNQHLKSVGSDLCAELLTQ